MSFLLGFGSFLIVCNPRNSFGLWLDKERVLVAEDKSLTKSATTSGKVGAIEEGTF